MTTDRDIDDTGGSGPSPRRHYLRRWLAALVLPVTGLVLVPAALVVLFDGGRWAHDVAGPADPRAWIGLAVVLAGVGLAGWTGSLFFRFGDGTAAPWDPPARFVVRGPYRHVRNPMITAASAILVGEAVWLGSWPIAAWFVLFALGNAIYIPVVEEKELEARFGDAYREYRRHVPRWIPRRRPRE